jgi:hypothetical protein
MKFLNYKGRYPYYFYYHKQVRFQAGMRFNACYARLLFTNCFRSIFL